jgi:hypothetical protein
VGVAQHKGGGGLQRTGGARLGSGPGADEGGRCVAHSTQRGLQLVGFFLRLVCGQEGTEMLSQRCRKRRAWHAPVGGGQWVAGVAAMVSVVAELFEIGAPYSCLYLQCQGAAC